VLRPAFIQPQDCRPAAILALARFLKLRNCDHGTRELRRQRLTGAHDIGWSSSPGGSSSPTSSTIKRASPPRNFICRAILGMRIMLSSRSRILRFAHPWLVAVTKAAVSDVVRHSCATSGVLLALISRTLIIYSPHTTATRPRYVMMHCILGGSLPARSDKR
jgi:hypothetical protein